jgi:predicted acetyltransferase
MLRLLEPQLGLAPSYRSFLAELAAAGESPVPFTLGFDATHFTAPLARLAGCARGDECGDGFVPHSTFWLVRDQVEIVAVSNLRHCLNDALRQDGGSIGYGVRPSARGRGFGVEVLRQTLIQARTIGLPQILLTCAKENPYSGAVIVRNGGQLISERWDQVRGETLQRYLIAWLPERFRLARRGPRAALRSSVRFAAVHSASAHSARGSRGTPVPPSSRRRSTV